MNEESLGYTFLPGRRRPDQPQRRPGDQEGGGSAAQQALKILSLRLPKVLGGSPFTPEANLRSRVGGPGVDVNAVIQSIISGGNGAPGAAPGGAAPVVGGMSVAPIAPPNSYAPSPVAPSIGAGMKKKSETGSLAQLVQNAISSQPAAPTFKPIDAGGYGPGSSLPVDYGDEPISQSSPEELSSASSSGGYSKPYSNWSFSKQAAQGDGFDELLGLLLG